jgi:hypothetical protein
VEDVKLFGEKVREHMVRLPKSPIGFFFSSLAYLALSGYPTLCLLTM